MKVVEDLAALGKEDAPISLAIGVFDGVHKGHMAVLKRAMMHARKSGGQAWVLTFDPHPARILNPAMAPELLTSTQHKLRLLTDAGMDGCIVITFTPDFAALTAEKFVERLCSAPCGLNGITVGDNWCFSKDAAGDADLLEKLVAPHGVSLMKVPSVVWQGKTISSSRIRASVRGGKLDEAASMLGRHFGVLATVTGGRQRGRKLGYPTANLDPKNEVMPPRGVYAVRAHLPDGEMDGVLNIGVRPTFGDTDDDVMELHLPDVAVKLYNEGLEVLFLARLRDEQRFASEAELKTQIALDIQAAKKLLKNPHKFC